MSSATQKDFFFTVDSWERQSSLAVDNSRPLDEIQHLGNLTRAFFDVPDLQSLTLRFVDYPVFYKIPQISSSQILPQRTWSRLHTFVLSFIPFHQREAIDLIERHRQVIKKLTMEGSYLLIGTWMDIIESMRQLEKLDTVSCKWLKGAGFGRNSTFPEQAVADYILHKRKENLLERSSDSSL